MVKKYLMFDIGDEKIKKLSEVLGSKSCKKILDVLSEKEVSETDLSKELRMPINTVEYNLKKLVNSGLVEKSKDFFWSVKGKKIPVYKVSNKHIVISPKSESVKKITSVIPSVLIAGVAAVLIRQFMMWRNNLKILNEASVEMADVAATGSKFLPNILFGDAWIWFLCGAGFALLVYLILNWKKL
jgi:DNA-binding transcriptional ArsR family regulator